jgi:ubiquinone/menaquinone biosynthesis C-methylase UbiE
MIPLIHAIYRNIRKSYGTIYKRRSAFVLRSIKCEKKLLILGARENFTRRIVKSTNNNLNYYLVDINPIYLKRPNFEYCYSDLNKKIPFSDDYCDCVVTDQLIEHLYKPDTLIKEIVRVCKNGSTVIIGSENLAAWHNIFALILTLHPFSDHYSEYIKVGNPFSIHHREKFDDPYKRHIKVPTIRALSELMEYYGLEVHKIKGFGHFVPFGDRIDKYHSIQFVMVAKVCK